MVFLETGPDPGCRVLFGWGLRTNSLAELPPRFRSEVYGAIEQTGRNIPLKQNNGAYSNLRLLFTATIHKTLFYVVKRKVLNYLPHFEQNLRFLNPFL